MDVGKSQRVPLSVFSALWDFFPKIKIFPPFNFLRFATKHLQLRQKCSQFRKCPPFSAPGARTSGPRRSTQSIFFGFSILQYCKLTLGSPFATFEPWIWRRLGPVPACFLICCNRMDVIKSQRVPRFTVFDIVN